MFVILIFNTAAIISIQIKDFKQHSELNDIYKLAAEKIDNQASYTRQQLFTGTLNNLYLYELVDRKKNYWVISQDYDSKKDGFAARTISTAETTDNLFAPGQLKTKWSYLQDGMYMH